MPGDGGTARQRRLPGATERGSSGSLVARLACVLRQVAGMPDYPGYAEHLRRCHPEALVPSESAYYAVYLRNRYGDGPTRCC